MSVVNVIHIRVYLNNLWEWRHRFFESESHEYKNSTKKQPVHWSRCDGLINATLYYIIVTIFRNIEIWNSSKKCWEYLLAHVITSEVTDDDINHSNVKQLLRFWDHFHNSGDLWRYEKWEWILSNTFQGLNFLRLAFLALDVLIIKAFNNHRRKRVACDRTFKFWVYKKQFTNAKTVHKACN